MYTATKDFGSPIQEDKQESNGDIQKDKVEVQKDEVEPSQPLPKDWR